MRGRRAFCQRKYKKSLLKGSVLVETAAFSCMEEEKMVFCLQRLAITIKKSRVQQERTQAASP